MAKFITIGYGDKDGYDRTDPAVREAAHAQDAKLKRAGALIGIAGTPTQVRNTEARKVETRTGAFLTSSLPIAGFAVIDAENIAAAIEMVSKTPCAVAYGVVEVWPLEEPK